MKEDRAVEWAARLFVATLAAACIWALTGCSHQYIPVESVRYDSIFLSKMQKDSIFVHDSLFIKEKGDTVFVDKYKYVYKTIIKTDTMTIERVDSIRVPFPVEKKLSRWQQVKMDFGGYLMEGVIVYLALSVIPWLARKTRNRT